MPSLCRVVGAAAVLVRLASVVAHPGCFTPNESPTLDVDLQFCELEADGACCTPTQEADAEAVFNMHGVLTGDCAVLYKQVACGACSAYSIHLYEALGNELGLVDGLTMKRSFCEELVDACEGQIVFPIYPDGQDYCDKHVVGENDLLWSYPIDPEEITFTSTGLVEAFPDLDNDDLPSKTIAMHMTPDGSEWWLAGQLGEIKKLDAADPTSATTVLDITTGADLYEAYEEGLLDFAFSPDFHNDDFFYCSYTVLIDGNEFGSNRLARFTYDSGSTTNTKNSILILLTSPPKASTIHTAGWVGFKPSDYGSSGLHDLYWAVGDGGPQEDTNGVGGDTSTILGSMVRIVVSTTSDVVDLSPSGNVEGPICANGFRNPFRCGFDTEDDTLYCGDVGHTKVEEISIVSCGNDYGWSRFEGSRCQEAQEDRIGDCATLSRSGITFPLYQYCHPDYSYDTSEDEFTDGVDICGARPVTGSAVIGGYVYRGQRFSEVLGGALVFGDAQWRNIYYLVDEGGEWVPGTIISDRSVAVITFAQDNDGELYVITNGRIPYQLPCGDLCAKTCLEQVETQPVYESLGCFADVNGDRALSFAKGPSCPDGEELMSPAICSSYCATIPGATLFGVEFAFECFCGNDSDDYDKHGSLPSDSCGTLCTGNPNEFCGGTNTIEVYAFDDGVPATPSPLPIIVSTPPSTPPPVSDDYIFVGCYGDLKASRVLSVSTPASSSMTIELCAAACLGSQYFGTEFGNECFCSATGDDPTELGTATCNMECAGDASQTCGGKNAISVYAYSDIAPTPISPTPITPVPVTPAPVSTPTPTSDDYTFLGCYGDSKTSRVLSNPFGASSSMTTEFCAAACVGSDYFGTEFSNECFCSVSGDDPTELGDATCDMDCAGDVSQTCGGKNAISVYEYSDTAPSPVTPAPVPTPTPTSDDYTLLGCFGDSKASRVLSVTSSSSSSMTTEVCAAACVGSEYFGTEFSNECFCSISGDDPTELGPATCDMDCAGDASQTCGGKNAISVYEYSDTPPSPTPTTGEWTFEGCYADSQTARIMDSKLTNGGMTIEFCADYCGVLPYFGLQYGVECWCAETATYTTIGTSSGCNYDCAGDASQTCGGFNAMSVYSQN